MQQTETYKLNLIEKTDTFSPDPLNENTQKVENALAAATAHADAGDQAEAAARSAADAALDQRVTVLEAHHVYVGAYTGNGTARTIELGFAPVALYIFYMMGSQVLIAGSENGMGLTMTETGFQLTADSSYNQNYSYRFLALA